MDLDDTNKKHMHSFDVICCSFLDVLQIVHTRLRLLGFDEYDSLLTNKERHHKGGNFINEERACLKIFGQTFLITIKFE